ncbi:hypothetical protein B7755_017085 [Streptomyces sp. NBS 14/10]|uniref:hypothetical protein n=1 Tax=Streptomyces sp. NBS 14/10 TaxID=1945643 RepID=UPI00117D8377|nr:hypothetical protein [Streptomyces sp. NBS 14/10]KAK1179708.1 hypothetical protein B7755_017085 [Streptomyces sp. NBS 14/10]
MTTLPDQTGSTPGPTAPPVPVPSTSRPFDASVKRLRDDCDALGVGNPVPLRLRVALRRRLQLRQWKRAILGLALLSVGTLAGFTAAQFTVFLVRPDLSFVYQYSQASKDGSIWPQFDEMSPLEQAAAITGLTAVFMWAVFKVVERWSGWQSNIGRRRSQVARVFLARRYAIVRECAEAIHACAVARQHREQRPAHTKKISKRLRAVRRAVLNAHSSRGSVPIFSARRKRLKLHERHVIAALQELEAKLDCSPNDARRELAEALLTIADRYCQGRVGDLLNEAQLTGVPTQRNWEALRYLFAFLLAAGDVIGVAKSGIVPEDAQQIVYALVCGIALVLAFGRQFRRAIDVFSAITGGGGP